MKTWKTIRKGLTAIIALASLVGILVWMSGGFRHKIHPGTVEIKPRLADGLTTDSVHAIVEMETTEVVGTLRAERRTAVSSKIMATIAEIAVRAGDKVTKGQVLVRLDDRDLRARLEQAKKAVEAAVAGAEQAEADLKRFQSLFKDKVIARQQLEQQESRYKVAQAEQKRAEEATRETEVALSYAIIESPTDGIVVDKQADKGDTATPGQPLLVLYDPSALRLEAAVRETLATAIHVGDRLRVRLDALDLDLEGRVDEIVPQAAAATRSVLIKVAVAKQPKMVEGMFGRLVIPTRERQRYCLARSAVQQVGQLRFVDVVTSGGVIERRAVKLGEHSEYGRVEVISGLKPGETVVLYGVSPPPFPPDIADRLYPPVGQEEPDRSAPPDNEDRQP